MFGNDGYAASPVCAEPDFEVQLKYIRERKVRVTRDIDAFTKFDDYHEIDRKVPMALLGCMHARLISLESDEARVLKRIDESAEK